MASQRGQTRPLSSGTRKKAQGKRSHDYNLRKTAKRNQRNQRLQNEKPQPQPHVLGINGDMSELEMAGNISPNTSWDTPSPDNSFYNESQYQVGGHGTQLGLFRSLGRSETLGEILDLVNRHPFSSTRRQSISPNSTSSQIHIHSHCSNERSHDYLQRSYSNSVFDPSSSDDRSTHSSIDPSLLALESPVLVYNEPSNSMSAGTEVRSLRPD